MKEMAGMLVATGFLPDSVNTPQKAVAIMLKGRELGLPPMLSFSHISVIKGKPTVAPELQMALIYRNCPGAKIDFLEMTDKVCRIKAQRPSSQPAVFTFTTEDARRAGLLGKQNWSQYPEDMLRSRCIGRMARSLFPDAIMGASYSGEEVSDGISNDSPVATVEVVVQKTAEKFETETPYHGSIYTGTTEQQSALAEKIFRPRKFHEDLWEDVHNLLLNKPSGEVFKIMKDMEARNQEIWSKLEVKAEPQSVTAEDMKDVLGDATAVEGGNKIPLPGVFEP